MKEDILPLLKLIADKTRLNMIGLLAEQPRSGDELAAMLGVNPSTVSQHISRMKKAGLVRVRPEQYYNLYEIDFDLLEEVKGCLTAVSLADRVLNSDAIDQQAYKQQIIKKWVVDGSLHGIPSQIQHRPVILNWLTEKFDANRRYSSEQFNDVLSAFCAPDCKKKWYKLLFKEQIMAVNREKTWYWRADSPLAQQASFRPDMMPIAELSAAIQAPRIRNGRLTFSHDPELLQRNVRQIAFRLQMEKPYTPAEIDKISATISEGDPALYRKVLIDKEVIHLQDDGTYQRDPLGPYHTIWSRG